MPTSNLGELHSHADGQWLWVAGKTLSFVAAGALAFGVTVALIYLEQYLISSSESALDESPNTQLVDIVRVEEVVDVKTRERRKKPQPPDEAPEVQKPQLAAAFDVDSAYTMSDPTDGVSSNLQLGSAFGFSDGEYLPIVKVAPEYPRRALVEGLAGWVIVEFTVTKAGTVADPIVVKNCASSFKGPEAPECADRPDRIFDRAALKAARKFKYKPKVIDGEPIATAGVRNKITFVLDA